MCVFRLQFKSVSRDLVLDLWALILQTLSAIEVKIKNMQVKPREQNFSNMPIPILVYSIPSFELKLVLLWTGWSYWLSVESVRFHTSSLGHLDVKVTSGHPRNAQWNDFFFELFIFQVFHVLCHLQFRSSRSNSMVVKTPVLQQFSAVALSVVYAKSWGVLGVH